MTLKKALAILRRYNKWRKGSNTVEMPKPKELSEAIDFAINLMANLKC